MSINALANAAAARRSDIGFANVVPEDLSEIAAASAMAPDQAPDAKPGTSDLNTALHVLFGYIPTEVVTLYVAVATALQPTGGTAQPAQASNFSLWLAFVIFAAATPLVVWVVFATKLKAAGKSLPIWYDTWPTWEMTAALIAFCAWAYALPDSPFRYFQNWYSPGLGGIAVLFASTVLGLIAPLFQKPLPTGPASDKKSNTLPVSGADGLQAGDRTTQSLGVDEPSVGMPVVRGGT